MTQLSEKIVNAVCNVRSNGLRSMLTGLSVAVGVCSVVIISVIGDVGIETVDTMLTHMGLDNVVVSGNAREGGLGSEELSAIKAIDNVDNAMPLMYKVTKCEMPKGELECMTWGVNEDAGEVIELEVLQGRLLNPGDVAVGARVCIIDEALALTGFGRTCVVGKTIQVVLGGTHCEFEIIGVVSSGVNMLQSMLGDIIPNFVYIPHTSMTAATGQQYYNEIAVKLENNSESTIEAIKRSASNRGNGAVSVQNLLVQKENLTGIFTAISFALTVIAGISLVVSGLSIMTVMLVSVSERTREIGIKKSIGAKDRHILGEFMCESAVISLAGGLLGAAAGILISVVGCVALDISPVLNAGKIAGILAFTIATGLVFGAYPAMKAAKLSPVRALRRD